MYKILTDNSSGVNFKLMLFMGLVIVIGNLLITSFSMEGIGAMGLDTLGFLSLSFYFGFLSLLGLLALILLFGSSTLTLPFWISLFIYELILLFIFII